MPIDTPPQAPTYQIERAAPAQDNGLFTMIAAASRAVTERLRATSEPSRLEKMLPQIDPRSQSLTRADRVAMVNAMDRDLQRAPVERASLPKSYIGERIAVAMEYGASRQALNRGELSNAAAKASFCRVVGLAFDRRAGAYLKGGEAAAASARKSISPEDVAKCKIEIQKAQARSAPPSKVERIMPAGRIDLKGPAPVRVDLMPQKRVRIDLVPEKRVRIDLVPEKRMRINPGVQSAMMGGSRE